MGVLRISPQATLRFLLAVLVLVFARRTYWELREWRWRRLPPDERFGFSEARSGSTHAHPSTWIATRSPTTTSKEPREARR